MEEKKTLYCFKLIERTGEIQRLEINNYEELHNGYRWIKDGGYIEYVNKKDLNIVKHYKVYSFDDNLEHATQAIYTDVAEKMLKAEKEYKKFNELAEKIHFVIDVSNVEVAT